MTAPRPHSRQPKQLNAGMFQAEISSFALRLAAEGKAAKTIRTYTEAVQWFAAARLTEHDSRASWEQVSSRDIQRWMAWLLDRYSTAYASNQYRALQQFFKWLAAEDQLPDPMAGLAPPRVDGKLVPVFTSDELARLEQACAGRSFTQRRDTAIIAVFTATGCPSWPACGMTPVTRGAVTSTCGSGRSRSAARAASPGSSGSATGPPSAWTGTCAPAPGTRRPGGRSCGWEPATGSR
jgi:integrase